jgi:hypothetical chaperone protein
VRFAEDEAKDGAARERLAEAWRLAGVQHAEFIEEPVGAAHHYAAEARLEPGTRFAVFDFGGGTLDVTVARAAASGIDVLATGGVPVGGDLLDSRIMETKVARHFGQQARYQPQGLPLPRRLLARLRSWQTIVELNHPDLLQMIREARRTSDQPRELAQLETMVTRNHGLDVFRAIERAKIELSDAEEAPVSFHRDGIEIEEALTREGFEAALSRQLASARACVLEAVASARCEPEEVRLVITTGGSSLIPAFRKALTEALPRASLAATGTFTSVAAGLAIAGARASRVA